MRGRDVYPYPPSWSAPRHLIQDFQGHNTYWHHHFAGMGIVSPEKQVGKLQVELAWLKRELDSLVLTTEATRATLQIDLEAAHDCRRAED